MTSKFEEVVPRRVVGELVVLDVAHGGCKFLVIDNVELR